MSEPEGVTLTTLESAYCHRVYLTFDMVQVYIPAFFDPSDKLPNNLCNCLDSCLHMKMWCMFCGYHPGMGVINTRHNISPFYRHRDVMQLWKPGYLLWWKDY